MRRDVEFAHLIRAMVPHFVSRQIVIGAGKVGAETEPALDQDPAFQLSQRAEFFEEVVGLETTLKRPIINTRDEPHSDAERFRRLHVIIGDANMSQTATLVKLGSTALLLAALEEFGPGRFPSMPSAPVFAVRAFAPGPEARRARRLRGRRHPQLPGTSRTSCGPGLGLRRTDRGEPVGPPEEVAVILAQWREMLDGVRDDRDAVADRVDWVAKWRVVNGYRERHRLGDHDARLRAIDLQYHDLRAVALAGPARGAAGTRPRRGCS